MWERLKIARYEALVLRREDRQGIFDNIRQQRNHPAELLMRPACLEGFGMSRPNETGMTNCSEDPRPFPDSPQRDRETPSGDPLAPTEDPPKPHPDPELES